MHAFGDLHDGGDLHAFVQLYIGERLPEGQLRADPDRDEKDHAPFQPLGGRAGR